MKYALAVSTRISFAFAGILLFLSAPIGHAQVVPITATSAPNSDFATAVQTGIQALDSIPVAQVEQQQISSQDYQSAWDEFGANAIVDGTTPPAEVNNQVLDDIMQSAKSAENYDQQEANYLQVQHITPEQVQSVEQSVGVDLPLTEQIDANPSIDANPDVNLSPADVPVPEDNASSREGISNLNLNESTSTGETSIGTSAIETNISSTTIPAPTTAPAGLEISQSVDSATPQAGAAINYVLTVSALGPAASTEVSATDILPQGLTFASSTASMGTYDSSTGVWNIGDMTMGSTAVLVVTATVDSSETLGQTISNTAMVNESSAETNPNEGNASSSTTITITPSDNMIFDAILQQEQAQSASSVETTTTASPPDTAPTQ